MPFKTGKWSESQRSMAQAQGLVPRFVSYLMWAPGGCIERTMIDPGSPTIMSRSSEMSSPDTSNPDHKRQNQTLYLLAIIRHSIFWQNQTLYLLPRQPQDEKMAAAALQMSE